MIQTFAGKRVSRRSKRIRTTHPLSVIDDDVFARRRRGQQCATVIFVTGDTAVAVSEPPVGP